MTDVSPLQIEELRSLDGRIEQYNEKIRTEGTIIDKLQELWGKSVKLERQAQGGRLRKMRLASRGAKGRGVRKKGNMEQAKELDAIYKKMEALEENLEKIEELKDKRQPFIKRHRAVLKELGVKVRLETGLAEKIGEEKNRLEYLEGGVEKIRRAAKLLKSASAIMQGTKQHFKKAKTASALDIIGFGGIAGELIAEHVKHKSMNKARVAMAPAQRKVKEANKILSGLNLRGTDAGPAVPQLNAFVDIVCDGFFDWGIHDQIDKAQHNAEMSASRVKRRAKELKSIEKAFIDQLRRAEDGLYELYLDAETAEAVRLTGE